MSKYFKYAIGEILLVVIGILIAIQINNWNNNRLDRQKEKQFLTEISNNLKIDLESAERVLAFNQKKDSAIDVALQLMTEPKEKQSTMKYAPLFSFLTEYQVFLANSVAFDNMTSSMSIGLISNDSLRQKLSSYYKYTDNIENFTQEQVKDQTRRFVDESLTMLLDNDLVKASSGLDIKLNQTEEFHTNPKNFKNLFNMKMNIGAQNRIMESIKRQVNAIINSIEK